MPLRPPLDIWLHHWLLSGPATTSASMSSRPAIWPLPCKYLRPIARGLKSPHTCWVAPEAGWKVRNGEATATDHLAGLRKFLMRDLTLKRSGYVVSPRGAWEHRKT